MAVDGGLRPGLESTASTHSVKQMVAVPRRWRQRALRLAEPAGWFLIQSLSGVVGCLVACERGIFQLPIQCVAVPADEGMYGKMCDP